MSWKILHGNLISLAAQETEKHMEDKIAWVEQNLRLNNVWNGNSKSQASLKYESNRMEVPQVWCQQKV